MQNTVNNLAIELLKSPLVFIFVILGAIYIIYSIVHWLKGKNKNNSDYQNQIQHFNDAKKVNDSPKICPQCGGKLVIRAGKYGKFWGCSNYPNCKFTLKIN